MSTATKLHFRITGGFLTRQARTLVLEGEWRRGLNLLVKGLDGCGFDTAILVLNGEKKFVGEDDLELVDEEPADVADYLEQLAWKYRGVIRTRRPNGDYIFMEPYASVHGWGPHDILEGRNRYNMQLHKKRGVITCYRPEARSVRYMDDQEWDRAIVVNHSSLGIMGGAVVLWREVGADPPAWIEVLSATDEADANWGIVFAQAVENGTPIDQRGHNWLVKQEPWLERSYKATYEKEPVKKLTPEPEPEPEPPPVWDKELRSLWGWITRDGRFWGCAYQGHKDLARRLVNLLQDRELDNGMADDEARKLNWLKITENMDGEVVICEHGERANAAQIETAQLWCVQHKVPLANHADVLGDS